LPGGEFGVEGVDVGDAPIEALSGQGGQFDLGDVEPGAVPGGVVDLQPLCQRERRGRPRVFRIAFMVLATLRSAD
jgi:hypothetical protein